MDIAISIAIGTIYAFVAFMATLGVALFISYLLDETIGTKWTYPAVALLFLVCFVLWAALASTHVHNARISEAAVAAEEEK